MITEPDQEATLEDILGIEIVMVKRTEKRIDVPEVDQPRDPLAETTANRKVRPQNAQTAVIATRRAPNLQSVQEIVVILSRTARTIHAPEIVLLIRQNTAKMSKRGIFDSLNISYSYSTL